MDQNQETDNTQPDGQETSQVDYITQSVKALKNRTRQSVSPWVRERLGSVGPKNNADQQQPSRRGPLTVGNTHAVLRKVHFKPGQMGNLANIGGIQSHGESPSSLETALR